MHTLILGITRSGKSSLAKELAGEFKRMGRRVAVLDPIGSNWRADYRTDDPDDFYIYAVFHDSHTLFIDEGGDFFANHAPKLIWLATKGRHPGHVTFYIANRYTLIPKTVRTNCENLYLFASHPDDIDELAKDFRCPELPELAGTLRKLEFLKVEQFEKPRRGRIIFKKGRATVEIEKRR